MKEDINLLPPLVQRARVQRLVMVQRDRIVYTILFGLLLITSAYATKWYTFYQTELTIQEQLANLDTELEIQEEEVSRINAFTTSLGNRIIHAESWTQRAVQVLEKVPDNMKITNLSVVAGIVERQPADAVVIEGTADNRESLASFEAAIRLLPWVVHLEAPLDNLAGGTPPFSFTFIAFHSPE